MSMLGIIFSNIYDDTMGQLTKQRTIASLPFGGRYRQIDFVLSNMVNSGIDKVGIITKSNYQSLMDHLSNSNEWDLNRKNGGIYILPPFGTGITNMYRGKLEALYGIAGFIESSKEKYILLSDTVTICNINYGDVLKEHIKSGKDVTVVCNKEDSTDINDKKDLILTANQNKVTDIAINTVAIGNNFCGMGMFLLEKKLLLEAIFDAEAHGLYYLEKDFLQRQFINNKITVNVYEYNKTVLRNENIIKYFNNNMKLMEDGVREDLFSLENPIYTKIRDEVPSLYKESADVGNSLIADGCIIKGTVKNSVIFRNVIVEEDAEVKNSIIMQGCEIKKGANIKYAILDKNVFVSENRTLIGADTSPIVITKGIRV